MYLLYDITTQLLECAVVIERETELSSSSTYIIFAVKLKLQQLQC